MGQVQIVMTNDPREFQRRVWEFLEQRIQLNVFATVLLGALEGRFEGALFATVTEETGELAGLAMRTPPFSLLVSELDRSSCDELLDVWLARDPHIPGSNSIPTTARTLAAAWRARTGGETECQRAMAMHALTGVLDPPHVPPGGLRLARTEEREQMISWWNAFAKEAGTHGGAHAVASVDSRMAGDQLFVWEDRGPTSVVALSPQVAGVVRIGPVYTPPEFRRRGYAGMAVAEASRHALANGATTCMLFTDVANPTSNKIYAEVGYERFADWEEYGYFPPPPD